ncbi:MAG TPA: hypothetical protein VN690_03220 [Terriglobales bacterium]|nr:hypothetical protein [Terriglobales bacterium]
MRCTSADLLALAAALGLSAAGATWWAQSRQITPGAAATSDCLAFQDGQLVRIRCGSNTSTLLHVTGGALWNFAVSGDAIAYQLDALQPRAPSDTNIEVVRPGRHTEIPATRWPYNMIATCGTVIAWPGPAYSAQTPAIDVLTGGRLSEGFAEQNACSRDRTRMAAEGSGGGITTNGGRSVTVWASGKSLPKSNRLAVSDDGRWMAMAVATSGDRPVTSVCVYRFKTSTHVLEPTCFFDDPVGSYIANDRIAVSDAGTVAFTNWVPDAVCDYSGTQITRVRDRSIDRPGLDGCLAVWVLTVASNRPRIVAMGTGPEWVEYADAQHLIALYGTEPTGSHPK